MPRRYDYIYDMFYEGAGRWLMWTTAGPQYSVPVGTAYQELLFVIALVGSSCMRLGARCESASKLQATDGVARGECRRRFGY